MLGPSLAFAAVVATVGNLGRAIVSLPVGWLADWLGGRRVLTAAGLILALLLIAARPAGRGRPVQIHHQRVNLVFVSTLRRRVSASRWGCEQAAIERDRAETRDGNWVGHDGKSAGAQA